MTIREDFSKIFSTETQNKTKNFFFYIAAWCNGEKHFCLIFPENLLFACEGEERVLGQEDRCFAMVCEHRRNPETAESYAGMSRSLRLSGNTRALKWSGRAAVFRENSDSFVM